MLVKHGQSDTYWTHKYYWVTYRLYSTGHGWSRLQRTGTNRITKDIGTNPVYVYAAFQSFIIDQMSTFFPYSYTLQHVFRDHPREVIKVVSYSRWFVNTGSNSLI